MPSSPSSVQSPSLPNDLPDDLADDLAADVTLSQSSNLPPTDASKPAPAADDLSAKRTTKRKKKRKKAATAVNVGLTNPSSPVSDAAPPSPPRGTDHSLPAPVSTSAPTSSAKSRRNNNANSTATAELALLRDELNAAMMRAADAEAAETAVNKGLLTARAVIAQRDRALSDAQSALSEARAETARLVEERKRADRQLVLLRSMSANLQEAREARDAAARRADDLSAAADAAAARADAADAALAQARAAADAAQQQHDEEAAKAAQVEAGLRDEVARVGAQADNVPALKALVVSTEAEVEALRRAVAREQERGRRQCVGAAGVGAAATLACVVAARALGRGGQSEEEA